MSLLTALQPAVSVVTALAAPDPTTASLTQLGVLQTALSGSMSFEITTINTGFPGAKGDKGDKGDPGDVGGYYRHNQPSADSTWTVNHNLGYRPGIDVYNSGGKEVWAEVLHVSDNQATILFDDPATGYAICS